MGSGSPRRQELLALMGLSFEIVVPAVDETPFPAEHPALLAQRLSLAKASFVAEAYPESLVIASDTLVVLDNRIFGKPPSVSAAFEMLVQLRNREHLVYSGLALVDPSLQWRCAQVAVTSVLMRDYSDEEIAQYVVTGKPFDKAGAYAIQSDGLEPVAQIEGCYANVMGLPMCHLYRALRARGVPVPVHPLESCPQAVGEGCISSRGITEAPKKDWCGTIDVGCGK
ncbi:MAG: septum formation protein Maf [Chloroflexi bacterium RBG_13_56_8]|nr:MAG: septum formation protein Maf [Chloroflexi bacterium RBG_13_56_8]